MEILKKVDNHSWEVHLVGRMTYFDKGIFKQIIDAFSSGEIKSLVLDFTKLEYMDSNSLGMLLILHEKAEESEGKMTICGLNGVVANLFRLSSLNDLFEVEKL